MCTFEIFHSNKCGEKNKASRFWSEQLDEGSAMCWDSEEQVRFGLGFWEIEVISQELYFNLVEFDICLRVLHNWLTPSGSSPSKRLYVNWQVVFYGLTKGKIGFHYLQGRCPKSKRLWSHNPQCKFYRWLAGPLQAGPAAVMLLNPRAHSLTMHWHCIVIMFECLFPLDWRSLRTRTMSYCFSIPST